MPQFGPTLLYSAPGNGDCRETRTPSRSAPAEPRTRLADIRLFRMQADTVRELPAESIAIEKSLQSLLEKNLEGFLGVRFLASEYITGRRHGGRIDTLGLDDNNCPVIIEYKRAMNENVINQGLFYLDWLMDHQGEFTLEVIRRLGPEFVEKIDWPGTRLLCIAGDFTRYDEYAVMQIPRNVELLRYRRYGADLLLLELVNSGTAETEHMQTKAAKAQHFASCHAQEKRHPCPN